METFKKLSIVIPAYNEGKTIHLILDRVAAVQLVNNIEKEIIIVNDCSKDDTEEAIQRYAATGKLNITYYKHEVNQGKGAAIHTGIKKATGDYVLIQERFIVHVCICACGKSKRSCPT
jgi:glycosyltransferase involved in cell wall biosynthesis